MIRTLHGNDQDNMDMIRIIHGNDQDNTRKRSGQHTEMIRILLWIIQFYSITKIY